MITTLEGLRRDLPTSYVEASTLLREAAATKVEATVSNLKEIDYAKKFRNAKQVVQREATNLKAAANKLLQSVDYDNDLRWAKEVVQSINKNGGVESTVGMHESLFSKWDANKVREQLFSKWKKHLVRAGTLRQEFIQRDGRIKDDEGFEKLIFRAYEIYLGKTKLKGDEDIASTSKTL
ncbi:hypothetical protein PsorP6_014785 [Peronosclerospora sorghi]|uniref:Uncharacterized protein n=1 Tax=Peronosclerospora sorghi TaxID=230839 RepID=A0ACC0VVE6_9STRA|nr:hypothetical protein PsorP6_014785 [Peronosclerospora sorghi]